MQVGKTLNAENAEWEIIYRAHKMWMCMQEEKSVERWVKNRINSFVDNDAE